MPQPPAPTPFQGVAAGIDVGGPTKGLHGVSLHQDGRLTVHRDPDPAALRDWCLEQGAQAVAIDAPCHWSDTGKARLAERELMTRGLRIFATPSRPIGEQHPFYTWMRLGLRLYEVLRPHYPLFDGQTIRPPVAFETFPHAIAWALAGRPLPARHKRRDRRSLLEAHGLDTSALTNIDYVDAALCALTARYAMVGQIRAFGARAEGYIVVPKQMP